MDEFNPLDLFGTYSESPVTENKDENAVPISVNDESIVEKATDNLTFTKNETVNSTDEDKSVEFGTHTSTVENNSENNEKEIVEEVVSESTNEVPETVEAKIEIPKDDKIDILIELQKNTLAQVQTLDKLFNAKIMHTDHEEKIVDQMHKELQKYKEDMYAQLVRPILLDVIEVRDSIMRMAATYLAKPEGEQNIPNKTFSDYAFDLQDILEKNSVEIYRSKTGDDFTPIKQRVIKKIPTNNNVLHGKVAESLSCGYGYNGKTISAEKITVYVYEENAENNENSEVIKNG